jgi:hypothetical protein
MAHKINEAGVPLVIATNVWSGETNPAPMVSQ